MQDVKIRLNGTVEATEVAPHSPPTWETLADGGNGEASFEFGRSAKFASQLLVPGTLLEILVGCMRVWFGRIADFDRQTGQVIGRGIHTDGLYIPALAPGGSLTRTVQTAIETARAAPWNWQIHRGTTAGDVSGSITEPRMVWPLIQDLATQVGGRAYFDPDAQLYVSPDPTAHTWTLAAEAAAFGQTAEGQATALLGRYFNGTANVTTLRPAVLPPSPRTEIVDLTPRGTMTLADANAVLDGALASAASKTGWVNGVTVSRDQITRNGTPAFLPAVHARNRMVRATGMPVIFGAMQATWLDTVLGKTRYTAGEDTIYLEPVQTAPRNLADIIAAG